EPRFLDPAHPAGINAVAAGLAIDDAAERSSRQPRHPGDTPAEARQNTTDVQLAAADPNPELPRLVEALHAGRREPQQGFAAGQQVVTRHGGGGFRHSPVTWNENSCHCEERSDKAIPLE